MNEEDMETVQEVPEIPEIPETGKPLPAVPGAGGGLPQDEADAESSPQDDTAVQMPDQIEASPAPETEDTGTDSGDAETWNETDAGTDTGDGDTEETGEDENGSITNITIVRPPAQIAYNMTADTDATYHVTVENEPDAPVPVVIAETLVETEREPGIMEKRLEDYSVTEGLLLCILIVLILRMILDYGRRLF